jgi:hypothetical protein
MKKTMTFLAPFLLSIATYAGGVAGPYNGNGYNTGSRIFSCQYHLYEKVNGVWQGRGGIGSYGKSASSACGAASQSCQRYLETRSQSTSNQLACLAEGASTQLLR